MLEQYKNRKFTVGKDCLEPGLKLERIRMKAAYIEKTGDSDEPDSIEPCAGGNTSL